MAKVGITSDQTVGAVMRRWPGTIAVFLRHGMACVGCPMARFDTVAEVAAEYAVPLARLLGELEAASERPLSPTEGEGGER